MARVVHIQTNFTGGEASNRLFGRVDLAKYGNSLEVMQNMLLMPQGGAIRRSGTRFLAQVKDSSQAVRLIPFQFSVTQAYVIEFGPLYVRFYRDRAQLTSGGTPYEIVSPYAADDLAEIKYTQSADILYLCHPNYRPRELQRAGDTSWSFVNYTFNDGPYLDVNTTATTLTLSGTSGSVTVTASASLFASTDVDRLIRWEDPAGNWTWLRITAFTSATVVTATIAGPNPSAGTATVTWRLGAWSDTTGWPWCASFHHQRLWFGGSDTQPEQVWASKAGDFSSHEPSDPDGTVTADQGINFAIADNQVNAIRALVSNARGLVALTMGGEHVIRSQADFEPISQSNIAAYRQSSHGTPDTVLPVIGGDTILFPERSGRRVRELVFNLDIDQFQAADLNRLAEHIPATSIIEMAFQQSPFPILWVVTDGGTLHSMTYERAEQIVAWQTHAIGGSGVVESAAVIHDDPYDLVYVVVQRTINGTVRRYVEFIEDRFEMTDDQEDAFYVDSGLTYDGAAATTITGLSHLNGAEVAILADGATHPARTVASGQITLDSAASVVHVGLAVTARMLTMPIKPERAPFDPRGRLSRIYDVTIRLHRTGGLKINSYVMGTSQTQDEIVFRDGSDLMDTAPPLFTGIKDIPFPSSHDHDVQLEMLVDNPQPLTVLELIVGLEIGEL